MPAIRMELDIPALDELKTRFEGAPQHVMREAHTAMKRSVFHVEARVKLLTPVRTATLRRSVKGRATGFGPVVVGLVWSGRNYAAHVELGTKPHMIYPKRKKALYWKGARHPVKRVSHPGAKGRHMFRDGLEASKPAIDGFFNHALGQVASRMDGA